MQSNRAWNYMKQNLMQQKGETDKYTMVDGDFNTLFSETDRLDRK